MESCPFFNQVTADLTPLNARKVAVKFDYFKIAGLIPVKAPGRARGELEITYLDEALRNLQQFRILSANGTDIRLQHT
ncbi:probable plastid-lipid-associated protein 4, chloroplastic isoform X2 [Coffea arabica]|uniref:Probable plastid-lipid-associated protein 4, chloroplastic isoform X2 n=1 Tax=Coffea arabica TaxID=13443 RepID=A0ABM4WVN9_COFAR